MEDVLRERRERGFRVAALGLVVFLAFLGLYLLRDIFTPLIAGFLLAYVLDPLAVFLERLKFSRVWAVIVIFAVAALVASLLFLTAGYYATRLVVGTYEAVLGEKWVYADAEVTFADVEHPVPGTHFEDRNGDGKFQLGYLRRVGQKVRTSLPESWRDRAKDLLEEQMHGERGYLNPARYQDPANVRETLRGLGSVFALIPVGRDPEDEEVSAGGLGLFAVFSWFVLCPLYVFFFLLQLRPIIHTVRDHLPGRQRARVVRIFAEIDTTLSAFFRGRLLICLVKGGATALGLLMLGVPFAVPIGLAAGFLSLVPYIGIWTALIPALILAWADPSGSVGRLLGIGMLFGAMEVVEGLVLVPAFLGKEVGLHPITIIVTFLIFGRVFGFLGVLLSVPLAAITKILAAEFVLPLIRSFAAEEPRSSPDGAEP